MPMAPPKPGRWCSDRIRTGLPQPEISVGYPHPQGRAAPRRRRRTATRQQGVLEMKCPALMLGYHNRPDLLLAVHARTASTPPATFSAATPKASHYFVGRTDDMFVSGGENIYPADVERMLERHPDVAQAAWCRSTTTSKGRSRWRSSSAKRHGARRERGQAVRACQRAGLSAPALRLVRRRTAARLDQQARPRGVAEDGAGRISETLIEVRHPEARAKRASKDARPGPSPFEGRHSASKTRVNALMAATSG